LVEAIGVLKELSPRGRGARVTLTCPFEHLVLGESIAVNGACLTVSEVRADGFSAECSEETLARTTLGHLRVGHHANLERALRLGDRLGGHLVSGHIDGTGTLAEISAIGQATRLAFHYPHALARFIAEKGSITIDGVSLTVNHVHDTQFEVAIIPHTGSSTTLGRLKVGDLVNLEVDLIARYLDRWVSVGRNDPHAQPSEDASQDTKWSELLTRKGYL
jgi:riboflavin synthase